MAWDDFTTCVGNDGAILVDLCEDAVKEIGSMWKALPQEIKGALIAAARWGGTALEAALAAVGIAEWASGS